MFTKVHSRIGCKGKDKFWYGYKQHTSVDMQNGLIQRITITAANGNNAAGLIHPNYSIMYARYRFPEDHFDLHQIYQLEAVWFQYSADVVLSNNWAEV